MREVKPGQVVDFVKVNGATVPGIVTAVFEQKRQNGDPEYPMLSLVYVDEHIPGSGVFTAQAATSVPWHDRILFEKVENGGVGRRLIQQPPMWRFAPGA